MRWRAHSLLWRTGQLLLTLLPLLLMASAGLMYLWQVKLAVEESLPSALRDYARRQAQLEVQLERVSLRWNRLVLTRPEVRTRSGERLLRARSLEARLPTADAPLTVEIDRPEIWLQRDRRGVWNIEPLLQQPRPPEPTPLTLRLLARQGTLYYDDFLPDAPVRATLWIDEFTYSQPRLGSVITLQGVSDALGQVHLRAVSDGKRWLIEANAAQVQGNRFKPYLPPTEFDLQGAAGQVWIQAVYEPDTPLQIQGVAQGVATRPTYRNQPLPWQSAAFHLTFTESHLAGELRTPDGTLEAQLGVDWSGKSVVLAGAGRVRGDEAAALWRLLRTDEPLIEGTYTAQVRFEGTLENLQLTGTATLERLRTPQGALHHLRSPVLLTGRQLLLPALQAEYAGRAIRGKLWLDTRPATPEFRLYATVSDLPLHRIPALREQKLRGAVDVSLIAYGSLDQPVVEANLLSNALLYNGRRLGGARARVRYLNETLQIPLAVLQGAAGLVQISGEIAAVRHESPRLDLAVDANELDLNLLAQLLGSPEGEQLAESEGKPLRLDGIGYLTAQIRGTWHSPEAVAEAVIFDGRLGDIGAEITVANLNLLGRELRIAPLQILRRASQLVATGVVQLPEQQGQPPRFQLQGDLYEFDLATVPDWLRRDLPLAGLMSGSFQLEGEPRSFTVQAALNAESLQYDQVLLRENQVQATIQVREGQLQAEITSAQAQVGGGVLTASGRWDTDGAFALQWRLENASLEVLSPYLPVEYRLTGQASVSGTASGSLDTPELGARVEGRQIALNGVLLGDVAAQLEYGRDSDLAPTLAEADRGVAGSVRATLTLHTPGGEARITALRYDLEHETLLLAAETDPLPVEWLRRVANALPETLPPAVAERIETLQGTVQAQLRLEGALREPTAHLTLNADAMEWRNQSLGNLALQASWQGTADTDDLPEPTLPETLRRLRTRRATIDTLRWQADTTRLVARGIYTPDTLNADLEIAQLPLRWARLWEPSLPEFDGSLDLSMIAAGKPQSPDLNFTATISNLSYGGYTIDQILFSQIEVREGAIRTDDALIRMRDYQARLSGQLPFHWSPLSIPDNEPIRLQARLREQPLSLLSLFVPVDPARTQGTVDALLEIEGTLSEPQPRGRLQIADGTLAIENLRTMLQEIGLEVAFDGREARMVRAQARSSEGGMVRLEGAIDLTGERPIADLRLVAESFTANEPKLPVLEGSALAVVSGETRLQGTLTEPNLQGTLQVQKGFLYLPAEFEPRTGGEPIPLNPRFDLQVEIAEGFTLRNPNLDAKLEGTLQVGGTLESPTLAGEFNLRGGALSLPTARLRLEPDSVARLNYPFSSPTGETIARIELDVRASTSVVAPDFTGDPIRYRVEVDVRGPLDDPERLQLTARSDPPGLSEQRILSLLGRGQALAAIAQGADPAQVFREQLGDILTTQVLPGLLSPLETGIAEAFDLEQFSVDYTGLRPASLYLVKNLFDGIGIAYRRGIGVASNEYQARLFYRLPFRNRLLQRLRIGFGFDHTQNRFLFIEGSVLFR